MTEGWRGIDADFKEVGSALTAGGRSVWREREFIQNPRVSIVRDATPRGGRGPLSSTACFLLSSDLDCRQSYRPQYPDMHPRRPSTRDSRGVSQQVWSGRRVFVDEFEDLGLGANSSYMALPSRVLQSSMSCSNVHGTIDSPLKQN